MGAHLDKESGCGKRAEHVNLGYLLMLRWQGVKTCLGTEAMLGLVSSCSHDRNTRQRCSASVQPASEADYTEEMWLSFLMSAGPA